MGDAVYTPITAEQFESVCKLIESTPNGISTCCASIQPSISKRSFYEYMLSNDETKNRYARAKVVQCDVIADEMVDIADDGSNDLMIIVKGREEYEVENKEITSRSKLRIETRKWLLSKLIPKKYGEVIHSKLSDADGNPLQVIFNIPRPNKSGNDNSNG